MPHGLEELLKPYGNTIGLIGVIVGIIAGLLATRYYYRRAQNESFESERRLAEQRRLERLRQIEDKEEIGRLANEIAAVQNSNLSDLKALLDAARADNERLFAPELVKKARRAWLKDRTEEAEHLFNRVLEEEPEFAASARYQLGIIAENRFDFEKAKQHYSKAAELASNNAAYLYAAGSRSLR